MADVAAEKSVGKAVEIASVKESVEPVAGAKDGVVNEIEQEDAKSAKVDAEADTGVDAKSDEDANAGVDAKSDEDANAGVDAKSDEDAKDKNADEVENGAEGQADSDYTCKRERKVVRQVEYYFGDANLTRDKFLLEQISKNEEGWVPISVLVTFKRLADISSDEAYIADALLKSDSTLLEVSEDRQKVRRHPERPIPEHNEEARKEIMSRTIYAKGFPLDTDISDVIDYFAPYEKVVNVSMRKYLDKPTKTYKFKGSVFVTFEKKEQAKEFIEKDKVLYKERELVRKWQEKYLEEKREEFKNKSKKSKDKSTVPEKFELPKGTVLYFEGATEEVTRELLRGAVAKVDGDYDIGFIEYSKGEKEGYIRFQEENVATKFLEKLGDKKLKLDHDNIELSVRTLNEEEEKTFLEKVCEHMKTKRTQRNRHKGGGHGHGHGNRKRRGGHDNRNDEKKKKVAAE